MAAISSDPAFLRQLERIVIASVAVTARVMSDLSTDLTLSQWRVLVLVDQRRGIPVSALAIALDAKLPSVSRLLGRLRERGLVETQRSPVDARIILVTLTDRGHQVRNRVVRARRDRFRQAIDEIAATNDTNDLLELTAAVLERAG
jgi:DNA-binding MarR family transcriptional regulator